MDLETYPQNLKWDRVCIYNNVILEKIADLFWEVFNSSLEKPVCGASDLPCTN